jgi:hypothetical protein
MFDIAWALLLGGIVSIINFYSGDILVLLKVRRSEVVSLGAGIAITYVFLQILPELFRAVDIVGPFIFVSVLVGFSSFHLIEKFIYQNVLRDKVLKEIRIEHSAFFLLYHIIIGILLVSLSKKSFISAVLFVIPLLFHNVLTRGSIEYVHRSIREVVGLKMIFIFAPLIGVVLGLLIPIPLIVFLTLFGFVGGVIFFVLIREALPKEKEEDPYFFLIGLFAYTFLITMHWIFIGGLL